MYLHWLCFRLHCAHDVHLALCADKDLLYCSHLACRNLAVQCTVPLHQVQILRQKIAAICQVSHNLAALVVHLLGVFERRSGLLQFLHDYF